MAKDKEITMSDIYLLLKKIAKNMEDFVEKEHENTNDIIEIAKVMIRLEEYLDNQDKL